MVRSHPQSVLPKTMVWVLAVFLVFYWRCRVTASLAAIRGVRFLSGAEVCSSCAAIQSRRSVLSPWCSSRMPPPPPPVTPIVRPCPPHAAPCRGRHHGPVVTAAMAAAVYSWHPKDSPNAGLSPLYRLIRARVLGWHCLASLSPPATRRIASPRQSFRLRHIIELLNSPTLTRAGHRIILDPSCLAESPLSI